MTNRTPEAATNPAVLPMPNGDRYVVRRSRLAMVSAWRMASACQRSVAYQPQVGVLEVLAARAQLDQGQSRAHHCRRYAFSQVGAGTVDHDPVGTPFGRPDPGDRTQDPRRKVEVAPDPNLEPDPFGRVGEFGHRPDGDDAASIDDHHPPA